MWALISPISLRIKVWDNTEGWSWPSLWAPEGTQHDTSVQISPGCAGDILGAATPSGLGLLSSMWLLVPETPEVCSFCGENKPLGGNSPRPSEEAWWKLQFLVCPGLRNQLFVLRAGIGKERKRADTPCVPAADIISPDPKTAQELAAIDTDEEIEAQSRESTCPKWNHHSAFALWSRHYRGSGSGASPKCHLGHRQWASQAAHPARVAET